MEFLGIMGTTEYYKGEIEAFYAVHNPAKLEGERHKTKLDSLLWKYKGRERKLLNKIKKKYDEEQKAVAEEEATRAVEEDPVLESTVFVQGISYDAKDQDLRDFFSSCGDIMALRMPRWQDSGKPMGYAHVEFASAADAAGAIKLSGEYMLSRYLDISAAKPRAADLHAVTVRGG